MNVEFEGRMFGDVLRDIIYATSESAYDFVKLTGITNVMLSNFMNHKKYPGLPSIRKIAKVLPEEQQEKFVLYFSNPKVKLESVKRLKESGVQEPFPYTYYDKARSFTRMYEETDKELLSGLQLQGVFKYLSNDEKILYKNMIIDYIIERNQAVKKAKNVTKQKI